MALVSAYNLLGIGVLIVRQKPFVKEMGIVAGSQREARGWLLEGDDVLGGCGERRA